MRHRSWLRRAVITGCAAALALAAVPAAANAAAEKYLVLYKQKASADSAAADVQRAGGELVANYSQIGVVVASASDPGFAERMSAAKGVEAAVATSAYAVKPFKEQAAGPQEGDLPNAPAGDSDSLSPLQWDMRQIHAPEAHAVTGGSPSVIVGDIDTGLDKDHPDLVQNIDFSKSVSCQSGAPDPNPAAWDDRFGHGTHTAGTIAAASNGFGIVGTAPNVKLAGIKSSTDDGYFFPEMVICSFMWAGSQKLDVTNNSYFADPYLYNCHNDPVQRAIWKAERRAIDYAQSQGVTVVASAGNNSDDLSHPGRDVTSPDFPPGSEQDREVGNECTVVPVEVSGVVGVSATGHNEQQDDDPGPDYLKSFYSSYGVSAVDLTAPGGDSVFGVNAEAPNGRVLSTYPLELPCARRIEEAQPGPGAYCYLQGTSMAAPHVSGVAALIISRFGDGSTPQNGKLRPGQVEAYLQQTADPQPCPSALPAGYSTFTQTSGEPQSCQGGRGQNSWYGNGQVNALRAINHDTGN